MQTDSFLSELTGKPIYCKGGYLSLCMHVQSCPTLCHPMFCSPPGSSVLEFLWDFPGKNTGVGCYFLLQGIFLTQGSNPCLLWLLHWQADSWPLHHLRNPGKEVNGGGRECIWHREERNDWNKDAIKCSVASLLFSGETLDNYLPIPLHSMCTWKPGQHKIQSE